MKVLPSLNFWENVGAVGEEISNKVKNRTECTYYYEKDDGTPSKPSLDDVIEASATKKAWE